MVCIWWEGVLLTQRHTKLWGNTKYTCIFYNFTPEVVLATSNSSAPHEPQRPVYPAFSIMQLLICQRRKEPSATNTLTLLFSFTEGSINDELSNIFIHCFQTTSHTSIEIFSKPSATHLHSLVIGPRIKCMPASCRGSTRIINSYSLYSTQCATGYAHPPQHLMLCSIQYFDKPNINTKIIIHIYEQNQTPQNK